MPSDKGNFNTKNWTPAVLAKPSDNIVSSDYSRNSKIFTPSYERECRPCMNQLIANEYQRIWWEERKAWATNHPDKTNVKKSHPKSDGHSRKVAVKKSTKDTASKGKAKKKDVASEAHSEKSTPQLDVKS